MKEKQRKVLRAAAAGVLAVLLVFCYGGNSWGNETGNAEFLSEAAKQRTTEEPFTLHALSAVLMDAATGRVLYGKEADCIRPMASTTKIMTCILALEQGNLKSPVAISPYAASMPDVQLNLCAGETYYLQDLLYSLMLESHNDSAVAVAEHIAGSTEQFAEMMNQKARDIGCRDTYFITPNGLDASEQESGRTHSTTASDLARLMRYCAFQSPQKEEFLRITGTSSRTIADTEQNRTFYLGNHNALLTMLPEALSGKTGFTSGAGYCYVAALEKDGKQFTAALLGCGWPPHKKYKWEDMRKLSSYAYEQYDWYEVFEQGKIFPAAEIRRGKKKTAELTMSLSGEQPSLRLLLKEGEAPEIRYEYPSGLEAPVQKGEVVGRAEYYLEQEKVAEYPVYAAETVERIDFLWCLENCADLFLCD